MIIRIDRSDVYIDDITIVRGGLREGKDVYIRFLDENNQEYSTEEAFKDYTTDLLITVLNELYYRLNEFPEENELPIIEFLNKKLMEEIFRRFNITKKQSDQRKNLLYHMNNTISVIDKMKEEIMKKIKEGGEKDED